MTDVDDSAAAAAAIKAKIEKQKKRLEAMKQQQALKNRKKEVTAWVRTASTRNLNLESNDADLPLNAQSNGASSNVEKVSHILILISSLSGSLLQKNHQDSAIRMFQALEIPYETIDCSLPENKEKRDSFFKISGIRGNFPQFFTCAESDKTYSYVGQFYDMDDINEKSSLPPDMIMPFDVTWDKLFGRTINTNTHNHKGKQCNNSNIKKNEQRLSVVVNGSFREIAARPVGSEELDSVENAVNDRQITPVVIDGPSLAIDSPPGPPDSPDPPGSPGPPDPPGPLGRSDVDDSAKSKLTSTEKAKDEIQRTSTVANGSTSVIVVPSEVEESAISDRTKKVVDLNQSTEAEKMVDLNQSTDSTSANASNISNYPKEAIDKAARILQRFFQSNSFWWKHYVLQKAALVEKLNAISRQTQADLKQLRDNVNQQKILLAHGAKLKDQRKNVKKLTKKMANEQKKKIEKQKRHRHETKRTKLIKKINKLQLAKDKQQKKFFKLKNKLFKQQGKARRLEENIEIVCQDNEKLLATIQSVAEKLEQNDTSWNELQQPSMSSEGRKKWWIRETAATTESEVTVASQRQEAKQQTASSYVRRREQPSKPKEEIRQFKLTKEATGKENAATGKRQQVKEASKRALLLADSSRPSAVWCRSGGSVRPSRLLDRLAHQGKLDQVSPQS